MATDSTPEGVGNGVSARPPRENLIRAISDTPTLERAEDGGMPTMVVDFIRFGEWTEINSVYEGRFMEQVAEGAADKTIAESRSQMKVLFNHGSDPQIGNKVLGPITDIRADGDSARGFVSLLDTSYNRDLIPGLKAGLYGSSFRFQVMREDFNMKPKRSDHNPEALPERTITEMKIREWGPVTFPAYAGASAGLRSLTDEFLFAQFVDDPDRLRELIQALAAVEPRNFAQHYVANNADARTSAEPEPSEATTPETTPGTEPEPSEATTHSNRGRFWFADTPDHLKRSQ